MQKTDKFSELVNQAASTINMFSSTDMSEVDHLQTILDQIRESVAQMDEGPAQLLEQAKSSTSDAIEALHGMLENQTQDASRLIETIAQAVSTLQSIADEIVQDNTTPDSGPTDTNSSAVETESAETIVITEEDAPLILDFVNESTEHIESVEAGLLELEGSPGDKEIINKIFRGFHTIKGMAGFLNLTEIGSLAHSAENLLDNARKGELTLVGENTDIVLEAADMIKNMLIGLRDSVNTDKPVPSQKCLPQLLARLKVSTEEQNLAASLKKPQALEKDRKLDNVLVTQDTTTQVTTSSGDDKIKVSTTRLDNLVNMVGELVVAQLMVTEEANTTLASDHNFCRKVTHQSKIVRELQELSMSMRMVPIQGVFQKMTRLVRDLSRKSGKNINLTTFGDQTELDRTVVDKITDPLVHMLRNAVDHGIESPEERTKVGKQPTGRIELRAYHEAGNIVIEIEDDGKGLNKERIMQKAINNGVITAEQQLSDDEIYKLIFNAGLSTAQQVTSVSGRGVGMDVVKKNVESLHGRIEISSTPGKGAVFTIRMPLTLAIIDGQVVRVGDNRYIIPIFSIERSFRPSEKQLSSVQSRGQMVTIHGELIPMVRLYELFGISPSTENPAESLLVIVEDDGRKCCLLVDELSGQQQVVIKSLGEGMGKVKGISGGAIMGDGRVSLILDIPGLMELAREM